MARADNDIGAALRVVPLDTGEFSVSATVDGQTLFDATGPATELVEMVATGGRAVLDYVAAQMRERAGTLTLGRLFGWG